MMPSMRDVKIDREGELDAEWMSHEVPAWVQAEDDPMPAEASAAGAGRRGLELRLLTSLPDAALGSVASRMQRPRPPHRADVPRELVSTARIGQVDETHPGIPVTWIDRGASGRGTIVHLAGGHFLRGPDRPQWAHLEEVRRRSGTAAVMVHYRMPPHSPFPAALDDAVAAIRAMDADLDLQAGRWVLSGDGAGGGLAVAACQQLVREGGPMPSALILSSPWTDLTLSDPMIEANARSDKMLSRDVLERCARAYAGTRSRRDPRVSPRFGQMRDLPPTMITAGSAEVLLGDARALYADLQAAGVAALYAEQPGAQHDYPVLEQDPAAQWAVRRQVSMVRQGCGLWD